MSSFTLIDQTGGEVPIVSVAMITYAHEAYIAEAIESVLMQKTNFRVQLVIAEDCSPDNTRQIILDYQKKYPDNIILILQDDNLGIYKNSISVFEHSIGKYIAVLEGDDYWTDPNKLQKQVDFLNNNPDYNLVCSSFISIHGQKLPPEKDRDIDVFTLLSTTPVGTLTTLFRNGKFDIGRLIDAPIGDLRVWCQLIQTGKFYKFKEVTAFYRVLPNSASGRNNLNKRIEFKQDVIRILDEFLDELPLSRKQKKVIYQDHYFGLMTIAKKVPKRQRFQYFMEYLKKVKSLNLLDLKTAFSHLFI